MFFSTGIRIKDEWYNLIKIMNQVNHIVQRAKAGHTYDVKKCVKFNPFIPSAPFLCPLKY